MKYCMAPFHGKVRKTIDENEVYCPLCKARMQAEKELKKEKTKKAITTAGKIIVGALPIALKVVDKYSEKKNANKNDK